MKKTPPSLHFCAAIACLLCATVTSLSSQGGYWEITQLPISDVWHPSINNDGEIVWQSGTDNAIYSTTRGKLAYPGISPHLANSGEVVYADWFGGPFWDLVSTTRGRLTFGGNIDIGDSDFDVNAQGEVVYVLKDTNNIPQVFSTVRHQITFDRAYHYNPCINDLGEIAWTQYDGDLPGNIMVSTTGRRILVLMQLADLNNRGDFCHTDNLEGPPGWFTWPHIFSSTHGVLIDDSNQYQWNGSINDAGTIVWAGIDHYGPGTQVLYQATCISTDTNAPQILRLTAHPHVLWPANHRMIPVKLTVDAVDDSDPSPTSQITQVTCNEPASSPADWEINGPLTLNLRASRLGGREGRIYTVVIECRDAAGNTSSASVDVPVPHDARQAMKLRASHLRLQHARPVPAQVLPDPRRPITNH